MADETKTNVTQTTLYQLELDYRNINCGMSYVIKTNDGSFFIIDGGYFTAGEEDRLYEFLRNKSDGEIIISGWFFSHAHQDHVGNFINFIRKYRNFVTLEKFFYNFQHVDFSGVTGDWKSCDEATVKEFYQTLDDYCKDVPIEILRTGQKFFVRELEFNVLYTHEDLYPLESSFNDHSTVLMMTVGEQKTLWLGDLYVKGSAILLNKYSDELKCDMVQIAHHGFNGANVELYKATQAKVALWPTADYSMVNNKDTEVNSYLLNDAGIIEHIVSGEGTAEMELPYQFLTAKLGGKKINP
ncbi:MAG: hypothetical protein K0R90_1800 [Oscillospiraceae bacterium]|nr:hypothetical protein [Oscillospiraceae bacterium]